MRKFFLCLILISTNVFALDLSQLSKPMPLEGRLSNTDKVESRRIKETKEKEKEEQKAQIVAQDQSLCKP